MTMTVRLVVGLVVGLLCAALIAYAGFSAMRGLWPEYAVAEPTKAYTLAMLLARLALGVVVVAGGGGAALLCADDPRMGWWFGGLFFAGSAPLHLYLIWQDYPWWYHLAYLGYIIPVAVGTARFMRRFRG
ncbi:MAG: hypothetical protein RLY97_184 [Pseudomonadota bacterium]|jgi:hypothetical protein